MKRFYNNNGKRFWLTLIISFVSMMSFATTYYVSSSLGNDANNGTSSSTPWKTLSKVNSTAFKPGDFVLFKCGDSWFGQLVPRSGSASGVITYGSYSSGAKPLIHQSISLNSTSNWVNVSGNIWKNSDYSLNAVDLLVNCNDDKNFSDIVASNSANLLLDQTTYNSGNKSVKFSCTSAGNSAGSMYFRTNTGIQMVENKWYEFSFYTKASVASTINQIFPTDGVGQSIGANIVTNVTVGTNWSKITCLFSPMVTTTNGRLYVQFGLGLTLGNSIWIDDLSFKELTSYYAGTEVGNILFNNQLSGVRKLNLSSCKTQGDYTWDSSSARVYLYSVSNPSSYYSDIKCLNANPIINNANKSYISIENLAIKYGGTSGIGYGENSSFQTLKNLDIAWCGGKYWGASDVRLGNGIDFYDNSHDNLVENCRIWEIYDAGVSNQSIANVCTQSNIIYKHNQIWNCEYLYEYFSNNASSVVNNIQFTNNTLYNAGGGWSHSQRPDPSGYSIRLAGTPINTNNFIITNNIILNATSALIRFYDLDLAYSSFKVDYNLLLTNVGSYGMRGGISYSTFNLYKNSTGWDKNSQSIDCKFTNLAVKDFSLLSTSPCINMGDPLSPLDPDGTRADIGAIYFNHPKVEPVYYTEYKSICDGSSYNGWTTAGTYERTLVAKSGADSIVTTNLTVNPKYSITENISINQGEKYNGWTTEGTYSRKLSSVSGCDSIITTNLSVAAIILKQGDLAPTHFKTVWLGQNGLNHMNIVVVSALIENVPLSVDDEIAVFSKSLCVGAGRLISSISTSDNTSYLTIRASQNDGTNNGFTDNDTIIFKIWDSQNQKELIINKVTYKSDVSTWKTNGKFAANSTAVAEIENYKVYTQNIDLQKGYNMVSTYLTAQDPNVASLTKPLIDEGNLIKLQDETGNSLENWGDFGGWVNKVGSIEETEGYKVQVANNCTLQVTGRPIAMPMDVYLKAGWNIISYPKTELVNAMTVVQSLIDQNKLIKVQDEAGNSIENWGLFGGWKNGIGNFIPGKAYKVKMSSDGILTFQESYTKSVLVTLNTVSTEHFSPAFEGNGTDHMNLNISGLSNSQISVGDELAAFDGNICVGAVKITSDDILTNTVSLVSSYTTDDKVQNGFKVGDQIQIIAWNKETNGEASANVEIVSGQAKFEKNATSFVNLKSITTSTSPSLNNNLGDEVTIDVYPNPCQGKFNVRYSEMPDQNSRVEVTDISGRKIISRIITDTLEEFEMDNYTAGLYIVKSVIGSKEYVQKLIVNK